MVTIGAPLPPWLRGSVPLSKPLPPDAPAALGLPLPPWPPPPPVVPYVGELAVPPLPCDDTTGLSPSPLIHPPAWIVALLNTLKGTDCTLVTIKTALEVINRLRMVKGLPDAGHTSKAPPSTVRLAVKVEKDPSVVFVPEWPPLSAMTLSAPWP